VNGPKRALPQPLSKIPTGIQGFDEVSRGGLPRNRTTLVMGRAGSGKTVFSLQSLVNAVRRRREPGIFVAFEESTRQIAENAASFDWGLPALPKSKLFFLDAHLSPTVVQSGEFDLTGMLAILKAKKEEMGARWIAFDGIDALLTLLQDPISEMREIYRVRDWLADNELTAIITAKFDGHASEVAHYGFMQFMVDCAIRFERRLEHGVSVHRLEITKYRGSGFAAGEFPLGIGPTGMEVTGPEPAEIKHEASTERVSAGFERLDSMLGGGLFRGSSTLITGAPGTSKTTLAGKFAESACRRGERTLFVSFDEGADAIVRNLSSVGIRLKAYVKSGLLRMYSGRTEASSPDEHLMALRSLVHEHQPRCMVVDPLSAMARAGGLSAARAVVSRLIYMVKDNGITVVITSLTEGNDPQAEATELQISKIADTWIHLSYLVRSGERNRALTIVKSRGTRHSNQVRELTLSETGPMLTDVYTAGGEVLMGTLRWEKEAEEIATQKQRRADFDHKQRELQSAEADTRARIQALELDLQRKRAELALYSRDDKARTLSSTERDDDMRRMRSADPVARAATAAAPPLAKRRVARGSGNAGRKKTRREARNAP
jgi:circadian clock protein KaiC